VTLLSLGVPMLLMGDEVRRTQGGNNNAYCRDDEGNWFDWTLVEKHADVLRFVQLLNARRTLRDETHERQRISLTDMLRHAKTAWHGVALLRPDWGPQSHSLAFGAEMRREGIELHLIANAFWKALDFELSDLPGSEPWRRWIDTSLDSPDDIVPWQAAPPLRYTGGYRAAERSVVVLWRPLRNVPGGV
jgi:glycogen operon protein